MGKGTKSNVVVIATLAVIFHVKNSKRIYEDKSTYGFVTHSLTSEDKTNLSNLIKQGMDKKMKEYYGERLEKDFSKIEYKVTFRTTEVDFIIEKYNGL